MSLLVAQELYRFFHVGDEEVKALRGESRDRTFSILRATGCLDVLAR